MQKRPLLLRILVILNALLVTVAFVGCPSRRDSALVNIAPPPLVTIAPYGGNIPNLVPSDPILPPPSPDPKNDKRGS
jgi:hypothetical protein